MPHTETFSSNSQGLLEVVVRLVDGPAETWPRGLELVRLGYD